MRTIRFRTCQAIGFGTGIAITSTGIVINPTTTIEGIPKPRWHTPKVVSSATPHQFAISKAPSSALSTPSAVVFLTTVSQPTLESHLRADTTPYSTPTNRTPRSATKPPWAWLPSLFFLGFALGIIRRVKMSLNSRNNHSHSSKDSDSLRSNSSNYSDSNDFSRGDRGK